VTVSAGGEFVTVSAGSFETRFRELGPDEAARPLPSVEHRFEASLPASVLSEGFNHLALALGHSRAWGAGLVGVELTTAPGLLRFAATDRQQLALVELPVPNQPTPVIGQVGSLLLSNSALDLMAVLLPSDGQVQLSIGDDQVDFSTDGLAVRCRLQDDLYPDYAPIVNLETARRIELSRPKLAAAVERVALLAGRAEMATVWIQLDADEVRLRATDLEVGHATETRPANITGDPCELGLYLWGFLAIVRRLRGNRLVIEFGQPDKPITVYAAEHPAFRYHLMPLITAPPPTPSLADRHPRGWPVGLDGVGQDGGK
jgi:DNA polymerase-3 subunit beta